MWSLGDGDDGVKTFWKREVVALACVTSRRPRASNFCEQRNFGTSTTENLLC